MHKTILRFLFVLALMTPALAWADDIEVLGGDPLPVKPNVMILFDNSGSMKNKTVVYTAKYDPKKKYPGKFDRNLLYCDWSGDDFTSITDCESLNNDDMAFDDGKYGQIVNENIIIAPSAASSDYMSKAGLIAYFNEHGAILEPMFSVRRSALPNERYWSQLPEFFTPEYDGVDKPLFDPLLDLDKLEDDKTIWIKGIAFNPRWAAGGIACGNWLNYRNNAGAQREYKYKVVQNILSKLIPVYDDYFDFGLMIFSILNSALLELDVDGGTVIAPCGYAQSDDMTSNEFVVKQLGRIGPNKNDPYSIKTLGATPLAEALAEAGLYFAGAKPTGEYYKRVDTPSFSRSTDEAFPPAIPNGESIAGIYDEKIKQYISPIKWRCQQNIMLILTDGASFFDGDYKIFHNNNYLPAAKRADRPAELYNYIKLFEFQNFLLDETSKFLYEADLKWEDTPDMTAVLPEHKTWNDAKWPRQNLRTYIISLGNLNYRNKQAADAGGGKYFNIDDSRDYAVQVESMIEKVLAETHTSSYAGISPAPVISSSNGFFAPTYTYLTMFKPESSGAWKGNLKKFGMKPYRSSAMKGSLQFYSKDGSLAVDELGNIKVSASSYWQESSQDGATPEKGGIGAIVTKANRSIYTTLNNSTKLFSSIKIDNQWAATLGIDFDGKNETDYLDPGDEKACTELVAYITGTGKFAGRWLMGDILHSVPAVFEVFDKTKTQIQKNVIFVGANDGVLHCIADDLIKNTADEQWAYIPPELLPKLKNLPPPWDMSENIGSVAHDYYVDGSPIAYSASDGSGYVLFGLRRGGLGYYCLKFSTSATADGLMSAPELAWSIAPAKIDAKNSKSDWDGYVPGTTEKLGQSWATPRKVKLLKDQKGSSLDAFLLTGGYDPDSQDTNKTSVNDARGRAVYAVAAGDGKPVTGLTFFCDKSDDVLKSMTHCLVELTSYDDNNDGCDDVVYAGDLGGQLWVFSDNGKGPDAATTQTSGDGTWKPRLVFKADNGKPDAAGAGSWRKYNRKFFNAPAVTQVGATDYVYIGSGDREHPTDGTWADENKKQLTEVNCFYCIKHAWGAFGDTLDDGDLLDVTADSPQGTVASPINGKDAEDARTTIKAGQNGWYIDLEGNGSIEAGTNTPELVISTPTIFKNIVYFLTYVPADQLYDLCGPAVRGVTRLWALDYLTGEAVYNFHRTSADEVLKPTDNAQKDALLTKEDRFCVVGNGMGFGPSVIITDNGVFLNTGVEGVSKSLEIDSNRSLVRYFWREVFGTDPI